MSKLWWRKEKIQISCKQIVSKTGKQRILPVLLKNRNVFNIISFQCKNGGQKLAREWNSLNNTWQTLHSRKMCKLLTSEKKQAWPQSEPDFRIATMHRAQIWAVGTRHWGPSSPPLSPVSKLKLEGCSEAEEEKTEKVEEHSEVNHLSKEASMPSRPWLPRWLVGADGWHTLRPELKKVEPVYQSSLLLPTDPRKRVYHPFQWPHSQGRANTCKNLESLERELRSN